MKREPDSPQESDSPDAAEPATQQPRWVLPEDLISRCTSVVLLLCLYSALCIWVPAGTGVRANPSVMPPDSKPAWNFLFLYEYVRLVPPFVGALTPAALLLVLGAVPYLDRNPAREPRRRVLALTLAAVALVAILTLTYLGWVA